MRLDAAEENRFLPFSFFISINLKKKKKQPISNESKRQQVDFF